MRSLALISFYYGRLVVPKAKHLLSAYSVPVTMINTGFSVLKTDIIYYGRQHYFS